ncbi:EAL domain-containing protein [Jannaschia formosa]|uniref:EAL domain-containing protein n=1 Tax=Jannaschia formosa TaxID=2259592 RepID=UPI000E1C1073|nr:EAL domain-containing protein [Jannaschia formosa]TFL19694.1 EAL domain-containing protein [Jannaschia formosa]
MEDTSPQAPGCARCRTGNRTDFTRPITMAFQPIVDLSEGTVFAQEALVRGTDGASAKEVLDAIDASSLYAFDQQCRVTAIALAARLDPAMTVSINFMPNAVYKPETCIERTLWAADQFGFPTDRIIFELTEHEQVSNLPKLRRIVEVYRERGFRTAIDDFGAGFAGLGLLAELQPDLIKLDRHLVTGLDRDLTRRAIVAGICGTCRDLGITVIGEGVERAEESDALLELGVTLQQGYLFARPLFEGQVRAEAIERLTARRRPLRKTA